jgi:hypothetical protein
MGRDGQLVLVSLGRRCGVSILRSGRAGSAEELTPIIPATVDAEIG